MTLTYLKKLLTVGREIEMLTYNGRAPHERTSGTRQVVKVQSNGVWLAHDPVSTSRSFMSYPMASELEWHTEKHFTIHDINDNGKEWATREYLIKN